MSNAGAVTKKARAEVENVIDELVNTIESGVSHPDGSPGFEPSEAEQLRVRLRDFAEAVMEAAREQTRAEAPRHAYTRIEASIDAAVATIRKGVLQPVEGPGFGDAEADELRESLRTFAAAIVTAAVERARAGIDAPVERVVKTIRSGLFHVYGRASYAAITGDQLEAYLQTFADAVLTVVERDESTGRPVAPRARA